MARLTIPDEQTFAAFTVVTSTSAFPISFSLFAKADLTVKVDGVARGQSSFIFTGTPLEGGGYSGGTVTLNDAVESGEVVISRNVAPVRTSNFAPAQSTPAGAVDQALNRLTAQDQDLTRDVSRALRLPLGEDAGDLQSLDDLEGLVLGVANGAVVGVENSGAGAAAANAQRILATAQAAAAAADAQIALGARNLAEDYRDDAEDAAATATLAAGAATRAGQTAGYFEAATLYVPQGAVGTGAITAGSGGTNGTFALAFSGGNFSANPSGTFTVVGGAVTAITLTGPGLYIGASPTAPTLDFSASAGLTGAAATLTAGFLRGSGESYWTDHATDANKMQEYRNVGGAATIVADGVLVKDLGFLDTGDDGDIYVRDGSGAAPGRALSRVELSDQPISEGDPTNTAGQQVQYTPTGSAAQVTAAVVGDVFRLTSTAQSNKYWGTALPIPIKVGDVYEFEGRFTTTVSTADAISVAFVTSPTVGASAALADSATPWVMIRRDGVPTVQAGTASTNYSPLTTPPGVSGNSFSTEAMRVQVRALGDSLCLVQAWADGKAIYPPTGKLYDGPPVVGRYFWAGAKLFGNGSIFEIESWTVNGRSLDVPRHLFVSNLASPGASGTKLDPCATIAEVVEKAAKDGARRSLRITLLNSATYPGSIELDRAQWDNIEIDSPVGTRATIDCTVAFNGLWTETAVPGVWWTDTPPFLGTNLTYGGFVEVGSDDPDDPDYVSQTFGRDEEFGWTVKGRRLYCRLAQNTAEVDMIAGSQSVQTTGGHAGRTLWRGYTDVDPNTLTFRWSQYGRAVNVSSADQTFENFCTVKINYVDAFCPFNDGFALDRCYYEINGARALGVLHGSGFELNHSYGVTYDMVAEGTAGDNLHAGGNGTAPDTTLFSHHFNASLLGAANFSSIVGDNFSFPTPSRHKAMFYGGRMIGAGKSCLATSGGVIAYDTLFQGAVTWGVDLAISAAYVASEDPDDFYCDLHDPIIRGNNGGATVNMITGSDGGHAKLRLFGDPIFDRNEEYSMWLLNSPGLPGTVAELEYDPTRIKFRGPIPTWGSDIRNNDGTVTIPEWRLQAA